MTLGTEKGETRSYILTIYPLQSNHCVKGLLMINTSWPYSSIKDFLRNAAPTYTHNYWCLMGVRGTLPHIIPLAIATGHGYLLGDILLDNKFNLTFFQLNFNYFLVHTELQYLIVWKTLALSTMQD